MAASSSAGSVATRSPLAIGAEGQVCVGSTLRQAIGCCSLGVPDQAKTEVEAELAALRRTFDEQFVPELQELYAALLEQHLGAGSSGVLAALENANVQIYLAAVEGVEAELAAVLRKYLPRVKAALSPPACRG